MNSIDFGNYDVEIVTQNQDDSCDEILRYLSNIINDRSIPENQKQSIRKQFDEILKLKQTTMKPPTIILNPKHNEVR